METSTPAPEDVNTLLVLSRELSKELPENDQTFNGFGGIEIGIADMGLLDEGDAIVRIDGTPHIVTAYGECKLNLVLTKSNCLLILDKVKSRVLTSFVLKHMHAFSDCL